MGISNSDRIIIYCFSDLISSCRAWFQFLYFGHDPKLVSVLNGGMKKWKLEGRKVTNSKTKIIPSKYKAKENKNMIKTKLQIIENIKAKKPNTTKVILDEVSVSPRLATFTLVHVLKEQELFNRALDVLDILEEKGENKERIESERAAIMAEL